MFLLLTFSFLAGIVTILSPCILPILPLILSSSFGKGKEKPLGIVVGFILSFTFFTLFLTAIVKFFGIQSDGLRTFSVIVIFFFGLSMLLSGIQKLIEKSFAYLSKFVPQNRGGQGFGAGLMIGISIGLLWTPCVGPIMASIISLALTGSVTINSVAITLSYATGTAVPMLSIIYGGQKALNGIPWFVKNSTKIQKFFGVVMMVTAVMIYFNFDRTLQSFVLKNFPDYGSGLTKIENNTAVTENLNKIGGYPKSEDLGKTTADLTDMAYVAPDLVVGGQWFNLPEGKKDLSLSDLRGKVVLIDFWTYTCINCIRTLPYLNDWHNKYVNKGLVIIGVHTPEFEFEKIPANVQKAIKDFKIGYVVMQDNDYATWNKYNNHYWPAEYLIDKDGRIRLTHFGEGDYDRTERSIQSLLSEAGSDVSQTPINSSEYTIDSQTPETYLGYSRLEYLASPEKIAYDRQIFYTKPVTVPPNKFALSGEWLIGEERAMPASGAELYLNYSARNVFLVMRPKNEKVPGKIRIYLNDDVINETVKGEDVKNGIVIVDSDRLYSLVSSNVKEGKVLRLEFLDDNIELYAFTFG